MPSGSRVRANNAFGSVSDNPLTAVATTFNSAALTTLPAISAGQHAVIVFDPKRVFGQPEIVVVTAHVALSTMATITRATYGTIARSHPMGTSWAHVTVDEDYIEILSSTSRPTDPFEGQHIYETDTKSHRHYTGALWNSAPPIGTILPYAGSTEPDGYRFANGAAVSRTGITADLFAVCGTTYGVGDGATTFNLPNLNGRVPVGRDATQAEFDVLGEANLASTKNTILTTAQLPIHAHGITDVAHNHTQNSHNHTQNSHGHSLSDPQHGHGLSFNQHKHSIDGDYSNRIVVDAPGSNDFLVSVAEPNRTVSVSFTDINLESVTATGAASSGTNMSVNFGATNLGLINFTAINIATTPTNIAANSGLSSTNNAGSGDAFNNLQPYLVVNWIIKI